jgi:hypothetical protein
MSDYPEKPIWDDNKKYKVGVISALKEFKRNYPYAVGNATRMIGMSELLNKLNAIYGINPVLNFSTIDDSNSFTSHYDPLTNTIMIAGKLSIITFLHEYAHARGKDEFGAVKWSLSLFKRCYPIAFTKLIASGHCMVEVAQ